MCIRDSINIGTLGLIDAVDRYDASRGVPFKAYAEIRIQGAMFDSLRGDDWVPRSVRRKVNRIEHAKKSLTFSLGRDPSRDEMADALEMSTDEYDALVRDARIKKLISLDISTTEDGHTPLVEIIPGQDEGVDSILCREELKSEVAHAVSCLPEKERVAVTLYYLSLIHI